MHFLLFLSLLFITIGNSSDRSHEIMLDVKDAVFSVKSYDAAGEDIARGSAFVIEHDDKYYTLTAAHVCYDFDNETPFQWLGIEQEGYRHTVKVLRISDKADLCLLENPRINQALDLADGYEQDEYVYAIGYPIFEYLSAEYGRVKGPVPVTMSFPWFSETSCVGGNAKMVKDLVITPLKRTVRLQCRKTVMYTATTVQMDGGASGGPLVNDDSEVLGVSSLIQGNIGWLHTVTPQDIKAFIENR